MRTYEELSDLLTITDYWEPLPNGAIAHSHNHGSFELSSKELETINPDMPLLLASLSPATDSYNGGRDGFTVYQTVQYWLDLNYVLVDTQGNSYVLGGIEDINVIEEQQVVEVKGHYYTGLTELNSDKADKQSRMYAKDNMNFNKLSIAFDWLDTQIPDWRGRLATISALDIPIFERHKVFLGKNPATSAVVALPDDVSITY